MQANHVESLEAFLDGKPRQEVRIGGKTPQQLESMLEQAKIRTTSSVRSMLKSPDFTTLDRPQTLNTVTIRVKDLLPPITVARYQTSDLITEPQIFEKINFLGLAYCPAEIGPHMRIAYLDQPIDDDEVRGLIIGMKPILDHDNFPLVFNLVHDKSGLWLYDYNAQRYNTWDPNRELVLRLPEGY